jgi:hypothetical protein
MCESIESFEMSSQSIVSPFHHKQNMEPTSLQKPCLRGSSCRMYFMGMSLFQNYHIWQMNRGLSIGIVFQRIYFHPTRKKRRWVTLSMWSTIPLIISFFHLDRKLSRTSRKISQALRRLCRASSIWRFSFVNKEWRISFSTVYAGVGKSQH